MTEWFVRSVSPWRRCSLPLPGCFLHSCWCVWSGQDPAKYLRTTETRPPWHCARPKSVASEKKQKQTHGKMWNECEFERAGQERNTIPAATFKQPNTSHQMWYGGWIFIKCMWLRPSAVSVKLLAWHKQGIFPFAVFRRVRWENSLSCLCVAV